MDRKVRERAITKTCIIAIFSNVFLAVFKVGAGWMAGSIAIVLDAVNNLTDALGAIITIVGIKLAKRKPSKKHPFGYGRVEYFGTVIISLIILFAGITSILEAGKKVLHPQLPQFSAVTILIVVVAIAIKFFMGRYVKLQGEKYHSDSLIASGTEASLDVLASSSTLIGIFVTKIFGISIDGWLGIVISALIAKAGAEMFVEAVGNIVGNRVDSEIAKNIKETVASVPGVLGAYDLVLHNYGPNSAIGTIHVEIPAEMCAGELHELTVQIQNMVYKQFQVFLTVGIYAIDTMNDTKIKMRKNINDFCMGLDGVLNTHGIFISEDKQLVSFDATIDFTVKDKRTFAKKMTDEIQKIYPGYRVKVNLDVNYSD